MLRRTLLGHAALAGLLLPLPAVAALRPARRRAREAGPPEAAPDSVAYGAREDVLAFAHRVADEHGLELDWVRGALGQARMLPTVARLMMPGAPGSAKNWAAYRTRSVDAVRIRAGLAFWSANDTWLRLAEERYGVPPDIVLGIIGIETIYGRHTGSFRVIDSLATLSFDFPTGRSDRSPFFRSELESFLLMCDGAGVDPLSPRGSYAGAMGMGQFMPSSALKYGIDFDEDGQTDLQHNPADVIGSVAHYLAAFGWERDVPARAHVVPPQATLDKALLLVPDIVPTFSAQEFIERGAELAPELHGFDGKLALVELQNGDAAPSYVAGTRNFYVITRYNWSSYYAMAVIELGEAIARERARHLALG
jgi:membrane-bound lytic murein transglycosylase B